MENCNSEIIMTCGYTGKRCYTEREAGRIINACHRHHNNDHLGRQKDIPRRKYFCRECGCWHLTSMSRFDAEAQMRIWEVRFYEEVENKKRG